MDVEVFEHLNLQCRPGAPMFDWVDEKVAGTSSNLSTKLSLNDSNIMFYNPLSGRSFQYQDRR